MPRIDHSNCPQEHLDAQAAQLEHSNRVDCRCGKRLLNIKTSAYHCLYCKEWFCPLCAEEHFGCTVQQWLAKHKS